MRIQDIIWILSFSFSQVSCMKRLLCDPVAKPHYSNTPSFQEERSPYLSFSAIIAMDMEVAWLFLPRERISLTTSFC